MQTTVIKHDCNSLQVKFDVTHPTNEKFLTLTSSKYVCGAVAMEVRSTSSRTFQHGDSSNGEAVFIISARFIKIFDNDGLLYVCKMSSIAFKNKDLVFDCDKWHEIFCYTKPFNSAYTVTYSFDLTVEIDIASRLSPLSSLFEDTDLTDFKLCASGGSVSVHSAVLASFSPVLKTMFSGDWKEVEEAQVTVANTSIETLEHFKEYVYLDKLPQEGIEELVPLASYYMIPDLTQKCTIKLLNKLNVDNIAELIELGSKYKIEQLIYGILHNVKYGNISLDKFAIDARRAAANVDMLDKLYIHKS